MAVRNFDGSRGMHRRRQRNAAAPRGSDGVSRALRRDEIATPRWTHLIRHRPRPAQAPASMAHDDLILWLGLQGSQSVPPPARHTGEVASSAPRRPISPKRGLPRTKWYGPRTRRGVPSVVRGLPSAEWYGPRTRRGRSSAEWGRPPDEKVWPPRAAGCPLRQMVWLRREMVWPPRRPWNTPRHAGCPLRRPVWTPREMGEPLIPAVSPLRGVVFTPPRGPLIPDHPATPASRATPALQI